MVTPCFASPQWCQNQSYTRVVDTSMTSPLNQEHGWDEASTSNNQEIVQTTCGEGNATTCYISRLKFIDL